MKKAKKILVLGSLDHSLLNFRGPLLRALVAAGHEVLAAAPPDSHDVPGRLAEFGVRFVPLPLVRTGVNPLTDWKTERQILAMLRRERPDVFLGYTIKPVVYGAIAARKAGVPQIYALVTGLGTPFHKGGCMGWLLRQAATLLYRRGLAGCTRVIVQNGDIADYFVKHRVVQDRSTLSVVAGSGVDLAHFPPVPEPDGVPVFLLLARMLRDKGVGEYVAAARLVKTQIPEARFLLVGNTDPNPTAISVEQLKQWNREGVIEYRSAVSDVRPLLADCAVYVLPSYHEGMPRSVLEAMATGRPVITTDTIGCRETIINAGVADSDGIRIGENGMLVPVRSIESLATVMLRLASDFPLRVQMGRRGRKIVEQQFDVRRINDQMLQAMDLLPAQTAGVAPGP